MPKSSGSKKSEQVHLPSLIQSKTKNAPTSAKKQGRVRSSKVAPTQQRKSTSKKSHKRKTSAKSRRPPSGSSQASTESFNTDSPLTAPESAASFCERPPPRPHTVPPEPVSWSWTHIPEVDTGQWSLPGSKQQTDTRPPMLGSRRTYIVTTFFIVFMMTILFAIGVIIATVPHELAVSMLNTTTETSPVADKDRQKPLE